MKLKQFITQNFEKQYGDKLRNLWVEVAKEFSVEYEIVKGAGGKKLLRAKDPASLMALQFGSGTLAIRPERTYDKIKKEFQKRAAKVCE